MNKDNLITVVFTKVKDTDQLEEIISATSELLVVYRLVQNNGTVAYVFNGIVPDTAYDFFKGLLKDSDLDEVDVVISRGNAFER